MRIRVVFAASLVACLLAVALMTSASARPPSHNRGPSCGATVYKSDGAPWVCSFADDFDATALDTGKWSVITTAENGITTGPGCFVDSPDNVSESNGTLNLTVRKEAAPFTCQSPNGAFSTQYSAGQVATYGHFAQTYGRFAVRARFPAATVAGLQSSLWMWPENNVLTGLTGEIDIAEEYSALADRAIPYLHYSYDASTVDYATDTNVVTNNYCLIDNVDAFHEYAVEWTSTRITVRYDGQTCLVDNLDPLGSSPFDQPFFVALTQGLGIGNNAYDPATTPLPAVTQIDWVHVWK